MHTEAGRDVPVSAPKLREARTWLGSQGKIILETQIQIARTPGPPFRERARAELIASLLRPLGIAPEFDEIGNLLAWLPNDRRAADSAPIVVAAHVDTVFGPETPIDIRRVGPRCIGPGIADNARGLAVAIAVLRTLLRFDMTPRHPILFAFTVGEEGQGDLRGVTHLFSPEGAIRAAAAFIALDGSGLSRIIHRAVGSRRYRITVRGSGGHSWTDWGRPNPASAIGTLIHHVSDLPLPREPQTTLTVARLGGGTSINAIPAESWVELDLRSESTEALQNVETLIRDAATASAATEEKRRRGSLAVAMELIGERPAGELLASHPLVQAADEATIALGEQPLHTASSTDANVPLALDVPAIAIGGGGLSGDTHTENEWFEDVDGAAGALRLLSLLARIARL